MIYGTMTSQTPLTPRQRRRQQKTLRILEAAVAILANDGFSGLTIQRLARELDYTPGALYRYFDSKDAILIGVQRLALGRFTTVFTAARALGRAIADKATLEEGQATLVEMWAIFESYKNLVEDEPTRFAVIAGSLTDPRQLVSDEDSAQILPPFAEMLGVIEAALAGAAEADVMSQGVALDRAIALMTALMGVMTLRKVQRLNSQMLDVERLARLTFRSMLLGWGVAPTALNAAEVVIKDSLGADSILDRIDLDEDE